MNPSPPKLRKHFRRRRRALSPDVQTEHAEQVARAVVNSGVLFTVSTCGISLAWNPAASRCPENPNVTYTVYRSTDPVFTPGDDGLFVHNSVSQWDEGN